MLKLLLGDPNARKLKRYQPIVSDINLLEEEIAPRVRASIWFSSVISQARAETSAPLLRLTPKSTSPVSSMYPDCS